MDLVEAALSASAVLLLVLAVLFATRVLILGRSRGAFDCSWRPVEGGRWALGVARVTHDAVEWWRVMSLSPRPRSTWRRSALQVTASRAAEPGGVPGLLAGSLVVSCAPRGEGGGGGGAGSGAGSGTGEPDGAFELAMTRDAYTGFASWLESAPPRGAGHGGVV